MSADRYLFGPVPSRRLGRSLGVDLVPLKTCTLNCIYCQLGRTPVPVIERRAYVPIGAVINELKAWRERGGAADVVTLAGSGEPTLHTEFGSVLNFVKNQWQMPVVLLTNGTLLGDTDVADQALTADTVKVTLSTWDEPSFQTMHRPHRDLHFRRVYEGMQAFRNQYAGTFWVEVFLVDGLNTTGDALQNISHLAEELRPDRIHINTAVRPAAEGTVSAVSSDVLESALRILGSRAEIVVPRKSRTDHGGVPDADIVYGLIERHPCTEADVASAYAVSLDAARKVLGLLVQEHRIIQHNQNGTAFYTVTTWSGSV